jgi:hypothetical protein
MLEIFMNIFLPVIDIVISFSLLDSCCYLTDDQTVAVLLCHLWDSVALLIGLK